MKKTYLLFVFTILATISCSNDDNINDKNNEITPPEWIQGTWYLENGNNQTGYKFTNDDFCIIALGIQQSCFKESIKLTLKSGNKAYVEQKITNNKYRIEITILSQTSIYEFNKISNNKIEWINDPLGNLSNTYYIKQ